MFFYKKDNITDTTKQTKKFFDDAIVVSMSGPDKGLMRRSGGLD